MPSFTDLYGLVEPSPGILELVGDRLETLERFVERDFRLSHCARQSPRSAGALSRMRTRTRSPVCSVATDARTWPSAPFRLRSRGRAPRAATAQRDGAAPRLHAASEVPMRGRSRGRASDALRRSADGARRGASRERDGRASVARSRDGDVVRRPRSRTRPATRRHARAAPLRSALESGTMDPRPPTAVAARTSAAPKRPSGPCPPPEHTGRGTARGHGRAPRH